MATLEVGQTAPDFALAATTDERVVLSEVLARASAAVLLFYRFDFGPI
jgi:peroxiredoxin